MYIDFSNEEVTFIKKELQWLADKEQKELQMLYDDEKFGRIMDPATHEEAVRISEETIKKFNGVLRKLKLSAMKDHRR